MATKITHENLKKMCEHFGLPKSKYQGKTGSEMTRALRDKTGLGSIAAVARKYDRDLEGKDKTSAPEKTGTVEVIEPGREANNVSSSHNVDVAAPTLNFHVAPASIAVNNGEFKLVYFLSKAWEWLQAYIIGLASGVGLVMLAMGQ